MAYRGTGTVLGDSTTPLFWPLTEWISTTGIQEVRTRVELRSQVAGANIASAYQVADSVNSPGSVGAVSSYLASEGEQFDSSYTDLESALQGKLFVRFGVYVKKLSGLQPIFAGWSSIDVDVKVK